MLVHPRLNIPVEDCKLSVIQFAAYHTIIQGLSMTFCLQPDETDLYMKYVRL